MNTRKKRSRKSILLALACAVPLFLSACGSGGEAGGGSTGGSAAGGEASAGNGGANAVEHTLIAGHQLAVGTPFDQGLNEFARLVEEKTEGRVVVEVHPNAALGTEPELFQGLQTGTIDVGIIAPGSLAEFMPQMSILSMPFLITDREQRDAVIEGPIAEQLAAQLLETTGTTPLSYFGGGYRQMFFTEPAESIEAAEGRLFRVQPSNVLTDSFAAMGLVPTVIAYNELYNALQQGVVQGADNESVYIDSQKFFEVAPHILRTNHEVTIRPLIISQATLDRLGDELGALVMEAGREAGAFERELEAQADDAMLEELATRPGVTVTDVDTSGAIEAVEEVWRRYAAEWEAEDLLEQIIELAPAS